MKFITLGTLAYTVVTFPLAVVWHIVLFKAQYLEFGYFEGEPVIALGFSAIIIQGFILSFLYPYVSFKGRSVLRGLKYSLTIGAFFWTSHVLAFVAKNLIRHPGTFVVIETFYLFLQFLIFGVLVGLIHGKIFENKRNEMKGKGTKYHA